MATVNLAPGTEYLIAARRRQRLLLTIAAIIAAVLFIVWLIIIGLRSSVKNQIEETRGRLRAVETEIARLEAVAQRIQLFEDRLVGLNQLLDSHINWDPLLKELERLLPPPARLVTLTSRAQDGDIELVGVTDNLDQLAQALASLENEPQHSSLFFGAHLVSVGRERVVDRATGEQIGDRYRFVMRFSYNPKVLTSL